MEETNTKPSALLEQFKTFEGFCRAMLDAFVVVDATGRVVKSNALFSQLVGLKAKQILKAETLDEMIKLELDQKNFLVKDILQTPAPTRWDEIHGVAAGKTDLNLIIGYYPFCEGDKVIGGFILIRDVTAETNLQGKYKDKAAKSITDPLTGAFNRAHFEEFLPNHIRSVAGMAADSDHRNISVMMADIDHFKKVNDVHGHPGGDLVIKSVAEIMMKCFRKTDVICRYGGEEFLIIFPATPIEGAVSAGEKFRKLIEAHDFMFEGKRIPVTISLGVAQLRFDAEDGKQAIARADEALYDAKKTGRNRVSVHVGTGIKTAYEVDPTILQIAI